MYDIAIIGAGINGCSISYEFMQEGKRVLLLDKDGIASGGSGAAGAFISPKFSKSGELREMLDCAFSYSINYYKTNFPNSFQASQLLHISKDDKDDAMLHEYKKNSPFALKEASLEVINSLTLEAKKRENVSLEAGIVNAKSVCFEMSRGVEFLNEKVKSLRFENNVWYINEKYRAKEVVLATGAYEKIIKEPYLEVRGIWGHRIDVQTTTKNPYSLHQFVSISKSMEKDGKNLLAIGATHNIHYHPDKNREAYDVEKGRAELLNKASHTMLLKDVKIINDYVGLRSGSVDYMPLLGSLIDAKKSIERCGNRLNDKRISYDEFIYHPNLYIINGSGGYGFVLAPYLAKILKDYIIYDKKIDKNISPARYFARWARRNNLKFSK